MEQTFEEKLKEYGKACVNAAECSGTADGESWATLAVTREEELIKLVDGMKNCANCAHAECDFLMWEPCHSCKDYQLWEPKVE